MKSNELQKNLKKYFGEFCKDNGLIIKGRLFYKVNDSLVQGINWELSSVGSVRPLAVVLPLYAGFDVLALSYSAELRDYSDEHEWIKIDEQNVERSFSRLNGQFEEFFLPWLSERSSPSKLLKYSKEFIEKGDQITWLMFFYTLLKCEKYKDAKSNAEGIISEFYSPAPYPVMQERKVSLENFIKLIDMNDLKKIQSILEEKENYTIEKLGLKI